MSKSARLLAALVVGGVAVMATALPASAKGFSLDEVQIAGPGLDEPMTLKARVLSRPPYPALHTTFLPSHNVARIPPPDGALGPRYEVSVVLRLHMGRTPRTETVRRYLYPYAAAGSVMLTPKGQRSP